MDLFKKLWQCFFCWRVAPEKNKLKLAGADVVLAQSFGGRKDNPGLSNEALAKVVFYARRVSECERLPLIAQWEINACFRGINIARAVICDHRQPGKYLDTREVLLRSWDICQKTKSVWFLPGRLINLPWNKAIIVAHPDHLWRVMRAAEKVGFQVMAADVSSVPYDKKSVQWWTRGRALFILREIPTRLFYFWKGWI